MELSYIFVMENINGQQHYKVFEAKDGNQARRIGRKACKFMQAKTGDTTWAYHVYSLYGQPV
jgi:hypothetical protein